MSSIHHHFHHYNHSRDLTRPKVKTTPPSFRSKSSASKHVFIIQKQTIRGIIKAKAENLFYVKQGSHHFVSRNGNCAGVVGTRGRWCLWWRRRWWVWENLGKTLSQNCTRRDWRQQELKWRLARWSPSCFFEKIDMYRWVLHGFTCAQLL